MQNEKNINDWPMLEKAVYNGKELCEILRISRTCLWRLTKSGHLRKLHGQGKSIFPRSEIIRYLENANMEGQGA